MAWWNRTREKKSIVLGTSDTTGKFLMMGNSGAATTPGSAKALYKDSPAVSIPINLVADLFANVKVGLQVKDELLLDHPVLDFIGHPSPHYSKELFMETVAKDYLITGEMAVVTLGNRKRPPLSMQPIGPENLSPHQDGTTDAVGRWEVTGRTLTGVYTGDMFAQDRISYVDEHNPLRELSHVRNYNPEGNSLGRGHSLLVSASREARQTILSTQHNVSLLENGGRISLVFHFEEDMEPEEFEAIQEKIVAQYSGVLQTGSVGVTAGGKMSIEELGKSPKDMDFVNLHELASRAIALVYKVPLPLVTQSRQTQNNVEVSVLALYDDAVLPLANRILGGLGSFLLPRFGITDPSAKLVPVHDSVTALTMRRNSELIKLKNINIQTVNELRAILGLKPVEAGDEVLVPANMIPVTRAISGDGVEDPNEPTDHSDGGTQVNDGGTDPEDEA